LRLCILFCFLGLSVTESTITEATKWLIVPAPYDYDDDDERGGIGGMLGRANQSAWRKPALTT
jgi:hypothetical protein